MTVSAAGSTDAGSGILRYEYETSTNGGVSWAGPTTGATVPISSEGQTLVQFRSVDNVSRVSPWVQAQVRIDTVKPSAPAVSGGSLTWKNVTQIAISASGSTDQAGGSGFAGYQYQMSTNGGATWTAAAAGNSFTVVNEGQTLVQFRSVDNAGNVSAWTPSRERGREYGTDRPQRAERADGDGWQRCDELLPAKERCPRRAAATGSGRAWRTTSTGCRRTTA